MRKLVAIAAIAAMLVPAAAFAQNAKASTSGVRHGKGSIHRREVRQQKRIGQGIKTGQLTAREARKLERKEAKLDKQIDHARQTGGGLNARERARIDHKQDQLSRQIYREKHDKQTRK